MTTFTRHAVASVCALSALALAGCGADGNAAMEGLSNDVTGTVKEWAVTVDAAGAKAGDVTFTITNEGTIEHEFLVVKTDIPDGEIPLVGDTFPEDAEGIEVIDEIEGFGKGEGGTLTVSLEPGNYQLVCNIASHYAAGMHTSFVVTS